MGTGVAIPELGKPGVEVSLASAVGEAENHWLCYWCHNRVAHEQDRFSYNGQDEFAFSNPSGARFEIIIFSDAHGCRQAGEPTLEHTWFPGYAWSYCHCHECGQHLGWYYSGPQEFVGLIKDRIVRALHVRN